MNMKSNYESAILAHGAAVCESKHVSVKRVNNEGIPTFTTTIMSGKTIDGTSIHKLIEIDDDSGSTSETIYAKRMGRNYLFTDCDLTRYRCAEMTSLAIKMLYQDSPKKVGFIGNGKINLLNCIAIAKNFKVNDIVIRGKRGAYAKNIGSFMTVCENVSVDASDDMVLLNQCDVVVVCTSSCEKENTISSDMLHGPKLIVALDCGFFLDETFRENRISYCDYPEQLYSHYKLEFPFDKCMHKMLQMEQIEKCDDKAVVYLYGVSIADAVATEKLIKRLEKDEMREAFYE